MLRSPGSVPRAGRCTAARGRGEHRRRDPRHRRDAAAVAFSFDLRLDPESAAVSITGSEGGPPDSNGSSHRLRGSASTSIAMPKTLKRHRQEGTERGTDTGPCGRQRSGVPRYRAIGAGISGRLAESLLERRAGSGVAQRVGTTPGGRRRLRPLDLDHRSPRGVGSRCRTTASGSGPEPGTNAHRDLGASLQGEHVLGSGDAVMSMPMA